MPFRGLDPRTRVLRWSLFAIAVGLVLGGTAPQALQQAADALVTQHDRLPWYATRLLAFASYWAITASVVYGLLLSTKLLDAVAHRPISFALHQDLASIGLGLGGVHAVLLTLDRSVPFSLADVLVPFHAPYRPLWVGLGQVALYISLVVVASFYVRRRIGQRTWRLLHYLTFLAFVDATAHGLLTGTDSGAAWASAMYVLATTAVAFLLVYRVVVALSARLGRARGDAPAAAPRVSRPVPRPAAVPQGPSVRDAA